MIAVRNLRPLTTFSPLLSRRMVPSPFTLFNSNSPIDRFFNDSFASPFFNQPSFRFPLGLSQSNFAPIDVKETESNYEIKIDLPGVDKKDVKITLKDNVLSIEGERSQEKEVNEGETHITERSFGAFSRKLQLSNDVDLSNISNAKMENGVLTLTLNKKFEEIQEPVRKIEIEA